MKSITLSLLFAFNTILCFAQSPILKFSSDKKFKIVQFTDLHIKYEDPRSQIAFDRMNQVLDIEKPDLVVFTGDLIYSKPADANLRNVLDVVSKRNIPFAVNFGNHDQEQGLSNEELFKIIESTPYNITKNEDANIAGVGNCAISIQSASTQKSAAILYFMDSHRDNKLEEVKGYDYIKSDQINWYKKRSGELTKANGGKPYPALCFFHIPLPEYNQAVKHEEASLYGIRRERACSPDINSGLFTAFKECNDVMGVFVGHDHDNDYAVNWYGILLAYGRFTGGPTEYTNLPNGARIIEMTEGANSFRSWIRTAKGIEQETVFPSDYIKK